MKEVSILGTAYPIKFGLSAIKEVQKIIGAKSMQELTKLDEVGIEKYPDIIHAGLVNGAKVQDTVAPTKADVESELDSGLQLYFDALAVFVEDVTPRKTATDAGN